MKRCDLMFTHAFVKFVIRSNGSSYNWVRRPVVRDLGKSNQTKVCQDQVFG